ncbi:glycerophosphodiester phosphodiesterase [Hellea balneolensis]|uniref:glycerophosphodiester phosphodiesterase n=1 Tax=Hellea balneolensis TaxID=287478 RepID=UPI0003FD0CE1|nr:glycerophosphodiester phosphodiesterase family protein [Hellea balneolensis]
MVSLSNLISHRFRGFAPHENTVQGLIAALDFGVLNLEFDIRVAKCGTPMIYHDEYALDKIGTAHRLSDVMARDYAALGGLFSHMPTAEMLFAAMGAHPNKDARFLIDIKDAGFEAEIHALVMLNRLGGRVIYVSWVPEALYTMHDIAPEADFCLSHWCQSPDAKTRKVHKVFKAKLGHIKRPRRKKVHGERSGWFVDGPLRGELRDIVTSVCVPQAMVSRALVDDYHKDGIEVSTFSYIDWEHINRQKERFNIDTYFIDNKRVFDEA